ncbi:MAG: NUDIX domain-containing protein [Ilumatobacteraceae bacterium]
MNAPAPSDPAATDPAVVPARPAATVVIVRDADEHDDQASGVEIFMLRRTAKASFAADMYVFPGGRVDDVDGAAELEPYCDGLDDAAASKMLGLDHGGLAYWVAAVRECFEEAGLLLARTRDGSPPVVSDEERRAVHDGELSMEELCRRHDLVLDLTAIRYVAHWVTPFGEGPRRFDTRFFLAAAPHGQEGVHDDSETVHSMWVSPHTAIAQAESGSMMMMPPTIANLQLVADCPTSDAALAVADAVGIPPRIQPRIRRSESGAPAGVSLPGDPDYDDLI